MPYIEETKEYIEFLQSKEFQKYLEEIQIYQEEKSGKIYNKFIDLDDKFIIKFN